MTVALLTFSLLVSFAATQFGSCPAPCHDVPPEINFPCQFYTFLGECDDEIMKDSEGRFAYCFCSCGRCKDGAVTKNVPPEPIPTDAFANIAEKGGNAAIISGKAVGISEVTQEINAAVADAVASLNEKIQGGLDINVTLEAVAAAQITAQTVSTAVAEAFAATEIRAQTSGGPSQVRGIAEARAESIANATASAYASALAEAGDEFVFLEASTMENDVKTALVNSYSELQISGDAQARVANQAVATAVAEVVAEASARAFARYAEGQSQAIAFALGTADKSDCPAACNNEPPPDSVGQTCEQLREQGQCSASLMIGYCECVCNACSVGAEATTSTDISVETQGDQEVSVTVGADATAEGIGGADASAQAIITAVASGNAQAIVSAVSEALAAGTPANAFAEAIAQAIGDGGETAAVAVSDAFALAENGGYAESLAESIVYAFTDGNENIANAYGEAISTAIASGGCEAISTVLSEAEALAIGQGAGVAFANAVSQAEAINDCLGGTGFAEPAYASGFANSQAIREIFVDSELNADGIEIEDIPEEVDISVEVSAAVNILNQLNSTEAAAELFLDAIAMNQTITVSNVIVLAIQDGLSQQLSEILSTVFCDDSIEPNQLIKAITATIEVGDSQSVNITNYLGQILVSSGCGDQVEKTIKQGFIGEDAQSKKTITQIIRDSIEVDGCAFQPILDSLLGNVSDTEEAQIFSLIQSDIQLQNCVSQDILVKSLGALPFVPIIEQEEEQDEELVEEQEDQLEEHSSFASPETEYIPFPGLALLPSPNPSPTPLPVSPTFAPTPDVETEVSPSPTPTPSPIPSPIFLPNTIRGIIERINEDVPSPSPSSSPVLSPVSEQDEVISQGSPFSSPPLHIPSPQVSPSPTVPQEVQIRQDTPVSEIVAETSLTPRDEQLSGQTQDEIDTQIITSSPMSPEEADDVSQSPSLVQEVDSPIIDEIVEQALSPSPNEVNISPESDRFSSPVALVIDEISLFSPEVQLPGCTFKKLDTLIETVSGKSYLFGYEQSYEQAMKTCDCYNSTLVSLESSYEEQLVSAAFELKRVEMELLGYNQPSQRYWMGIQKLEQAKLTSSWKKIDGTLPNYVNWKWDQPTYITMQDQDEQCGAVEANYRDCKQVKINEYSAWQDSVCSDMLPFICESETDTQNLEESEDQVEFLYVESLRKSYIFFKTKEYSWSSGQQSCEEIGGQMIAFSDRVEEDLVMGALAFALPEYASLPIWIGLSRKDSECGCGGGCDCQGGNCGCENCGGCDKNLGDFQWVSGQALGEYTNWMGTPCGQRSNSDCLEEGQCVLSWVQKTPYNIQAQWTPYEDCGFMAYTICELDPS